MSPGVLVVGLDGVPHWLLRQLADDGVMPNVAALLPAGTLRPLRAPVPDISSTSWASFLTGTDPGRHGVYGFVDLLPGTYDTYFPNLRDLKAVPLWHPVSAAGEPSLIVNVPGTYPAPAMHGALVAGFVAPDFDRAVHPDRLRGSLRDLGYQLDVEVGDVEQDPAGFLGRVGEALAARRRAFRLLLKNEPAMLAVCVITETDRVHHFLWRDLRDPTAPLHGAVLDFYRQVDEAVAELAELAGDGLILVSDHGFGPVSTQFYLNAWLRQEGYLHLPDDAPSLSGLDERTLAFALDPGRVFVNRAGRFPRGHSHDVAAAAGEISARLLALRLGPDGVVREGGDGSPLVSEVRSGAELYSGPCQDAAPDLVAMPAPSVQIRGAWNVPTLTAPAPLTGTHTREDALFWCRGDVGTSTVEMRDVAPTALAAVGVPAAGSMEGRDVTERSTR